MIAMLKLADSDTGRGFERRIFPRKDVAVSVEGRRLDNTLAALRQPVLKMSLRDVSAGGLCALSDTPIPAGERVTIAVPRRGTIGGWDAYGRVIRCSPSGVGYRVAVEFDRLPAA